MRPRLLPILLALALLAAAGHAAADDDDDDEKGEKDRADKARRDLSEKTEFSHRGDKWLLHNDQIAVWFHAGKDRAKPDMRVAWNGSDDEKSGYRVKVLRLCEVDDSLRCSGNLPRVNLAKADDWNVVKEQTNESLTVRMVLSDAQAIVTLVWHLNTTSHAVKYDVLVENWRWANASHKLLLDQVVLGKNLRNATGASVNVGDSGYIAWATSAGVIYPNGTGATIPVQGHMRPLDGDDDEDDKTGGHLVLVFEGPGGYKALDYDPELGIASADAATVRAVPGTGLLAGIATVAVAAWGLRRR